MTKAKEVRIAPGEVASDLTYADLRGALSKGWSDFKAYPGYDLFFAGFYVGVGLLLLYAMAYFEAYAWLLSAAAGFPLLAPFLAAGYYEISRRRELGLPLSWGTVLGALRGAGEEQILSMGVIVFVGYSVWIMVAHGIFAVFLGESGFGTNWLDAMLSPAGIGMLLVGGLVGALIAFAFYSITVISIPMLVHHDIDFITAIIVSLAVIRSNRRVMLGWAAFIAVASVAAMIPLFLGLLVVLPMLGHATWHLYRRAVPQVTVRAVEEPAG